MKACIKTLNNLKIRKKGTFLFFFYAKENVFGHS